MKKNTESLLEDNLHLSQSELVDEGLKVQNKAYGVLDTPFFNNFLKSHPSIKTVLDIGTGEGSFAVNIVKENADKSFVAIDLNKDLIEKADEHKKSLGLNNVEYKTAFFDDTFEDDKYDLIFTHFTLQHSTNPLSFIQEVFNRLNDGGYFLIVEEYWLDSLIKDETWNLFRKYMLDSYKAWGCNPYIPRDLARWLKNTGFTDIQNSLSICSPVTIGEDNFRSLVLTVPVLINKIKPGVWDEAFFPVLEEWINDVVESKTLDPFVTIAHVVAKKT